MQTPINSFKIAHAAASSSLHLINYLSTSTCTTSSGSSYNNGKNHQLHPCCSNTCTTTLHYYCHCLLLHSLPNPNHQFCGNRQPAAMQPSSPANHVLPNLSTGEHETPRWHVARRIPPVLPAAGAGGAAVPVPSLEGDGSIAAAGLAIWT